MQIKPPAENAARLCFIAVAASLCILAPADGAWAKHQKAQKQAAPSDPCAAPTAFVQDHIAKIRALQSSGAHSSTTVAGWFQSGNKAAVDPDVAVKISELRHDADGVNELLTAGGCKSFDIDEQLTNHTPQ